MTKDNEFVADDELVPETENTAPEDDSDLEHIEENTTNKIKSLRNKLKVCETEKMQHLEELQRTKADFLNTKRRLEEASLRDKERAINNQIEKLLPLCDSFQMAMSNQESWQNIDATWRNGVEGIYNQLKGILSSYGVTTVDPTGDVFDPLAHEAIGTTKSDTETDTIVQVLQYGYMRNGEFIRPAKVILSE